VLAEAVTRTSWPSHLGCLRPTPGPRAARDAPAGIQLAAARHGSDHWWHRCAGLRVADGWPATGAEHLVLTSRRGWTRRTPRDCGAPGIEVTVAACDAGAGRPGGTARGHPPTAVVHAAGVGQHRLLPEMTWPKWPRCCPGDRGRGELTSCSRTELGRLRAVLVETPGCGAAAARVPTPRPTPSWTVLAEHVVRETAGDLGRLGLWDGAAWPAAAVRSSSAAAACRRWLRRLAISALRQAIRPPTRPSSRWPTLD